MATKTFTEADLRKVYAELRECGEDAKADFGGEIDDSIAYELADCFMQENPAAVAYLKKVKRVQDVQGHLADYI